MRRLLILATTTGYQTRSFGEAARRVGVELVFATDRCHMIEDPWRDQALPIRFYDPDAAVAALVESAGRHPFDGILVVGDRPTVIAARVAEAIGLPGHPPEAAAVAKNKQRTRERLRAAGLPTPWFVETSTSAASRDLARTVRYPAVIKPVELSGSRGVMRVDDADDLVAAFERLARLLQSPDIRAERNDEHARLLVEGFIPGREYALEGVLHHGVLHVLAIFDKPDPLDGPFFEETIYLTPTEAPLETRRVIVDAVSRAAGAIGLVHGPVHAECRVNADGGFVLEVAARPIGGLCARARSEPERTDGVLREVPEGIAGSRCPALARRARPAHLRARLGSGVEALGRAHEDDFERVSSDALAEGSAGSHCQTDGRFFLRRGSGSPSRLRPATGQVGRTPSTSSSAKAFATSVQPYCSKPLQLCA
jgi:hypothetical protein